MTKAFATTTAIVPVWVVYTSNERLLKHTVPTAWNSLSHYQVLPSHADECVTKKRVSLENLDAIRARFLELYIHKTPFQVQNDLDTCQTFGRDHLILGCFERAMSTLEKYQPSDFHSAFLPCYIVASLNKHIQFMETVMCQEQCGLNHRERLSNLKKKFNVSLPAAML